jgi:hypothetical protein
MPGSAPNPLGLLEKLKTLPHFRLIAGGVAGAIFLATFVGAGASPVGPTPVSDVLGLTGEHGGAVSDAVHDAKEGLEEGDKVGPAVSEAACREAHNPDTLPDGAQAAHENKPEKDCTHPSNSDAVEEEGEGDGTDEATTDESDVSGEEELNHGQSVSGAVHEAKEGVAEGEKVGAAVSEAACREAHNPDTLPDGAQAAHANKPEKDCTHPSNAEDEEVEAAASEKGKASAPGQLKKQD